MNKEIKFQNAVTKAGYLKKESPGMIKMYQSRYYGYRDGGRALIWFKKQPNNIEERPKGVIMVSEIIKVEADEKDPLLFQIHYPERQFRLKAVDNPGNKGIHSRSIRMVRELIDSHELFEGDCWGREEITAFRLPNKEVGLEVVERYQRAGKEDPNRKRGDLHQRFGEYTTIKQVNDS
mgnify:CR=1 FL=1